MNYTSECVWHRHFERISKCLISNCLQGIYITAIFGKTIIICIISESYSCSIIKYYIEMEILYKKTIFITIPSY